MPMTDVLDSFKHHFKTTPHLKDTYHEDKYMMQLLIILKQIDTSLKEFIFKKVYVEGSRV